MTVTNSTVTNSSTETGLARPEHSITVYLAVSPAREAIDWYVDVLGARMLDDPIVVDDDRVGHAELVFGDSLVMLADSYPDIGHTAPSLDAGTPAMLTLSVDDADVVVDRAAAAGARVDRPVADTPYGHRGGTIRDPFGHRWSIQAPMRQAASSAPSTADAGDRNGNVGYVSLHVPDASRAIAFYAAALGWSAQPAASGHAAQVAGHNVSLGIWGGAPWPGVTTPGIMLSYSVTDIDAAVDAVRTHGGTAGDVESRPFGRSADCLDVDGAGFALHEVPAESADDTPEPSSQGDVDYVTVTTANGAATADFYGAVLGWQTVPGRTPGGRQVENAVPLVGIAESPDRQNVTVVFRVDDIDAAVERVRAAGGQAGEVETAPYGRIANCVDDQGLAFSLRQP